MGQIKVPYLVAKTLKSGKTLYYWQPNRALRLKGYACTRLSDDEVEAHQQTRKINEMVKAEIRQQNDKPPEDPSSLKNIAGLWKASPKYLQKAERTRKDHQYHLKFIEAWAGDKSVKAITTLAAYEWYLALSETKGLTHARNIMSTLTRIMAFAKLLGVIPANPVSELEMASPKAREQVWAPGQVAALIAKAKALERPSIALATLLAYWVCQRPADVRKLTWKAYDGEGCWVRQAKTGKLVWVKVPDEIRAELDTLKQAMAEGARPKSLYIIISEATGEHYQESNFQHLFAWVRGKAGLPKDLQFRDFRRTFLTDAGEGGATIVEMFSASGHSTLQSAEPYVKPTRGAAISAMDKVAAIRNHGQELERSGRAVGNKLEASAEKAK